MTAVAELPEVGTSTMTSLGSADNADNIGDFDF